MAINPFTAPACTISGLNDARKRLQTVYFSVLQHLFFNAMRFGGDPFTCQCKKEDKKAYGFLISHFYGSLSNDIMAMNGLNCTGTIFSLLFHAGKSPHSARQIARRQSSAQRFLAMKESTKERRGGIWTTVLEATVVNGGGLAPNCPNTETHSESWLQDSKTAV